MKKPFQTLPAALGIGPGEHVAFVGAGGKTTAMFALAKELAREGKRVITTTTTKIWKHEARAASRICAARDGTMAGVLEALPRGGGVVFLYRDELSSGKLLGVLPEWADSLYRLGWADLLVVEADGASGRPVKVPAEHEPVIPGSATAVVAVMGLTGLEAPFNQDNVFRPHKFCRLTGLRQGDKMSAEVLQRVFEGPEGLFKGAPVGARRLVYLNQMDMLKDNSDALLLAEGICKRNKGLVEHVVVGSLEERRFIRVEERL